ncbi:hypothetical protein NA56DRAFT_202268 [Hyaloscypha hepaticicola]|uniref:Uncharacterized protein n=1 Tax=Hyaloscypha hepaticicola TaxID=2082293 RepID=A0A2J6PZH9_9HELO|nr:hypothetical protein NA56DRAFT_202268 [Hyaloscypha hepaticicola]
MNGPPSQPEIKPNQTASAGFHLLKQACLHLLLTPNPHSGLCHLCRVSLFFLPLSQPPPLHPSFASSFGPIDQSTLITWLLSSLLFFLLLHFYLHPLFNPNTLTRSASLDLLILCSPTPCKKDDH